MLEAVEGNVIELVAEIGINVLRSLASEEYTAVKFYRHGYMGVSRYGQGHWQDALVLDSSRSSLLPYVLARPPEVAPLELEDGEPLKLRMFIDKSVVEVFANGRQCVALRVYPERKDSVGDPSVRRVTMRPCAFSKRGR